MPLLEDQMTWDALCQRVLNKIQGSLTKKEIPTFKKWFMKREKIGYLFEPYLILRCFKIWQDLKRNLDHFVVISGREGFGKSTLSFQMAAWVNPDGFSLENVCYGAKTYLKVLTRKADEYVDNKSHKVIPTESLVMDEGTELLSREALNMTNRMLSKTFFVQRALKFLVIINIPNFFMLDTVIRNHRVRTLIEVIERGRYKCITGRSINIVAKEGMLDKNVTRVKIPNGTWWHGRFNKNFPRSLDREAYEKHKMESIKLLLGGMKKEVIEKKFVGTSTITKSTGMSRTTVHKLIKNGDIPGKQFGNKWYVPTEAYENMITVTH